MAGTSNTNGGERPSDRVPADPSYSGAKAGSVGADFAGRDRRPSAWLYESAPMSALLAQNWWAVALRGLCGVAFGILALLMPGLTIAALILWFAAYMLVDGIFAIVAGLRAAAHHQRWGALILEGVADLIAGAIALLVPVATVLAFVWLNAAWAIISGGLMIAAVFRLHSSHGKWWLGLGGVISVLWGILLLVAPITGAIVLTWWLGAYALAFGIAMLVLSFRLKAQHSGGGERSFGRV